MPQALGLIATFAAAYIGGGPLISTIVYYGVLGIGYASIAFGLQAAFAPAAPSPADMRQSVRNPIAPRTRHYGRVRIGGPWAFGAVDDDGQFHKVTMLCTGELDAVEERYVGNTLVTVDGGNHVNEDPWDSDELLYEYRLGLATETVYSELDSTFPEWTSSHRGDGIASIYTVQRNGILELVLERWPQGVNTQYTVVARASKVYNPLTGLTEWTDNAAAVIRDYLIHSDGMRLPSWLVETPQAVSGWLAAAQACDVDVTLKAGGTEKQWRIWGGYRFDERPADVVGRFLAACDARPALTPDGGLTIELEDGSEPTVVLDEDAITGFADLSAGLDIMTTANTIRAIYTSVPHNYGTPDADPWIDEDSVIEFGEVGDSVDFSNAPSHGQCRRLMKRRAYRLAPGWLGSVSCNIRGLAAYGKRRVRIQLSALGIDHVFQVEDFRFDIGDGAVLRGVTMQVISMPAEAFTWDAATEEGTAPVADEVED